MDKEEVDEALRQLRKVLADEDKEIDRIAYGIVQVMDDIRSKEHNKSKETI